MSVSGKLYICATPIGNLEDITLRVKRILSEVDAVAAEDTRRTAQLMNHIGAKKKIISYHQHSGKEKENTIIDMLLSGSDIALVSDAGTPLISDPGDALVKRAIEEGVEVVPLPGASAVLAVLSVSGIDAPRFAFEGFFPRENKEKKKFIEMLRQEERAVVFFESPKRISKTLQLMAHELGERRICVARELTKLYEEVFRGSLREASQKFSAEQKGEFALVIAGVVHEKKELSDEDIKSALKEYMANGANKKEAVLQASESLNAPKNRVYALSLDIRLD
ncbi:MAG: 16S rRNA (cytidine(1402)-2'-O)-methyltransferase [Christensenellales bacterium]|jgi:16S rRNA (cytidine1402-2'-O)-methyltransferase